MPFVLMDISNLAKIKITYFYEDIFCLIESQLNRILPNEVAKRDANMNSKSIGEFFL